MSLGEVHIGPIVHEIMGQHGVVFSTCPCQGALTRMKLEVDDARVVSVEKLKRFQVCEATSIRSYSALRVMVGYVVSTNATIERCLRATAVHNSRLVAGGPHSWTSLGNTWQSSC